MYIDCFFLAFLVNRFRLCLLEKGYPFEAELSDPFRCLLEYLQIIVFLEDFTDLEYTIS